jgi:hypothetical protein
MKLMAMLALVGIGSAAVGGAVISLVWRWERRRTDQRASLSQQWRNEHREWK